MSGPSPLNLVVDPARASREEALRSQLHDEVHGPRPEEGARRLERLRFMILGLAGPDQARAFERRLGALPGVEQARVRFSDDSCRVTVADGRIGSKEIVALGRLVGLDVVAQDVVRAPDDGADDRAARYALALCAAVAVGSIAARVLASQGEAQIARWIFAAQLLVVLAAAWSVRGRFESALGSAGALVRFPARTALGVAAIVAITASLAAFFWREAPRFEVPATVLGLWLALDPIRQWLEERVVRASERGVRWPRRVTVRRDAAEIEVPLGDVEPGDVIAVPPGGRIAVDGRIRGPGGVVDLSPLLGQGQARQKQEGDRVWAGSLNGPGGLEVVADRVGSPTVWQRRVEAVRSAFVTAPDSAGAWGVVWTLWPAGVLVLAAMQAAGADGVWAVASPVVSALVLAAPVSVGLVRRLPIAASLFRAAEHGVLIRDAATLEALVDLDAFVFRDAGVLTTGRPEIEHFEHLGVDARTVARWVVAASRRSADFLSQAVERWAVEHYGEDAADALPEVTSFREIPGRGVIARVDGRELVVGAPALLSDKGIEQPDTDAGAGGWVHVAADGRLVARIGLFDPLAPEAAQIVSRLKRRGVRPFLAAAQEPHTAKQLARSVGIPESDVTGGVDIDAAAARVSVLRAAGLRVGAAGRADEDAPLLKSAHVGFASTSPDDLERRDEAVILLRPGASGVVTAVEVAHEARRSRRVASALAASAAGLSVVAAWGGLPPLLAVAAALGLLVAAGARASVVRVGDPTQRGAT